MVQRTSTTQRSSSPTPSFITVSRTSLTGKSFLIPWHAAADKNLSVLAPGEFDRASLQPSAPAASCVGFPGASAVSHLPLASASLAFFGDVMTYSTTPELLKTVAALATPTAAATTTASAASGMTTATRSTFAPVAEFTGAANAILTAKGAALVGAVGVAVMLI